MRRQFSLYIIIIPLTMILLLATGCGEEESRPPVIFSITADPDIVSPGGTSSITVEAGDPDKDEISYTWTALAGSIQGKGKTVTWKAPENEGRYDLTVTVSDGSGSVDGTLTIRVWTPRPGDYYPLAIGDKWTFKDNSDNTIEFEIVDTITIGSLGVTAFVKQITSSSLIEAANFSYITEDLKGVYQYAMGGSNAGGDTIIFSPELPIYKYPLIPGETWEVEFKIKLPEGYYVGEGTAIYEVISEEDLTVAAGSFRHVFQVREDFTWELLDNEVDHIVTHQWVAPDVGIVKFTQEENIGGETIITEAVLQSYSIK